MRSLVKYLIILPLLVLNMSASAADNYVKKAHEALYASDFNELEASVLAIVKNKTANDVNAYELSAVAAYAYYLPKYASLSEKHSELFRFLSPGPGKNELPSRVIIGLLFLSYGIPEISEDWEYTNEEFLHWISSFDTGFLIGSGRTVTDIAIAQMLASNERYAEAELRLLESIQNGRGEDTRVWDAALLLSNLAAIYTETGRVHLARKILFYSFDHLFPLMSVGHIHEVHTLAALLAVSMEINHWAGADLIVSILKRDLFDFSNAASEHIDVTRDLLIMYALFQTDSLGDFEKNISFARNFAPFANEVEEKFHNELVGFLRTYIAALKNGICSIEMPNFDVEVNKFFGLWLKMLEIGVILNCGSLDDIDHAEEKFLEFASEGKRLQRVLFLSLSRGMESDFSREFLMSQMLNLQMKYFSVQSDPRRSNYIKKWLQPNMPGKPAEIRKKILSSMIEFMTALQGNLSVKELSVRNAAVKTNSNQKILEAERYLTAIRERELYLEKLLEFYVSNVVYYYKKGEMAPFSSFLRPREDQLLKDNNYLKSIISEARDSSFVERTQSKLRDGQGAIFSFSDGFLKLTCLISKVDYSCWHNPTGGKKFREDIKAMKSDVAKEKFGDAKERNQRLKEVLFPKSLIELIERWKLNQIFFVPENNFWSIPIQFLWMETGVDASLIITPTIQALALDYVAVQPDHVNYDYVGIGDPNYSLKEIKLSNNIENIPGITFRSADYAIDLSQLSQLPSTNKEIKQSAEYFGNDKLLLLKSDASEKSINETNWHSSKFIHFATHALISGEMRGLDEPAIALSAVENSADSNDDGLLTASEISAYAFPNSFVLLSGCRTIADFGHPVQRGMSGLSLAFLGAGAKNVMVTQWQIPDETSSKVITKFLDQPDFSFNAPAALKATVEEFSSSGLDPYHWSAYLIVSYPARFNSQEFEAVQEIQIPAPEGYEPMVADVKNDLLALSFAPPIGQETKEKPWITKFARLEDDGNIHYAETVVDGRWEFLPNSKNLIMKLADDLGGVELAVGEFDVKKMIARELLNINETILKPNEAILQYSNFFRFNGLYAVVLESYQRDTFERFARFLVFDTGGNVKSLTDISHAIPAPNDEYLKLSKHAFNIWGGNDDRYLVIARNMPGETEVFFDGLSRSFSTFSPDDNSTVELYNFDLEQNKITRTGTLKETLVMGVVSINGNSVPVLGDTKRNRVSVYIDNKVIDVSESEALYTIRLIEDRALLGLTNSIEITEAHKYSRIPGPFGSVDDRVARLRPQSDAVNNPSKENNGSKALDVEDSKYVIALASLDPTLKAEELIWRSKKFRYIEDIVEKDNNLYVLFSDLHSYKIQSLGRHR